MEGGGDDGKSIEICGREVSPVELGSGKYGYVVFLLYSLEFYGGVGSDGNWVFLLLVVGGLGAHITEGNARFGLLVVMKSSTAGIAIMKQRCVFFSLLFLQKNKLKNQSLLLFT